MQVQQLHYLAGQWNQKTGDASFDAATSQLALVFGAHSCISDPAFLAEVQKRFPAAQVVTCSTSGEIIGESVYDESAVVTAIRFDHTSVRPAMTNIRQHANSYDAGLYLMQQLQDGNPGTVFI